MKIKVVAYVLNELYNNGIFRSSHKLDNRDFMQLARAAKGSVLRKFYFDEKANGSIADFVGENVKAKEYEVISDERCRKTINFNYKIDRIVRLPEGNGIIRITAISNEGHIDYTKNFASAKAGSEPIYASRKFLEDTGLMIYIPYADEIRLFAAEDIKLVEMLAIIDNDDTEINEDVAWEIINYVLVIALRVIPVPIDKTDDSSPATQMINSKLAAPQTFS